MTVARRADPGAAPAGDGGTPPTRGTRKDVRVRKARHSGACPVCRRLVLVGDLIASVKGAPFMCLAHLARDDTT